MNNLEAISFTNIDALAHGEAKKAINVAIARAVADLVEFGTDGLAREVHIKLIMRPKRTQAGQRIALTVVAATKMPSEKPVVTHGLIEMIGDTPHVFFNPASCRNPDQLILPLIDNEEEK